MPYPPKPESWRRYFTFWRNNVRRDVDAEVRFHLDARIEELIGLGVEPNVARAQALEDFGDVADVQQNLRAIDERIADIRQRVWDA